MNTLDKYVGWTLAGLGRGISGTVSQWVNCVPSTRQRIYYANHSSHLDILVLWSSLPSEVRRVTRPVAARDYWDTGSFKRYLALKVFNAIMIERPDHGGALRSGVKSIEDTVTGLGTSYSLIIFPEGTRSAGNEAGPFKSGLYHLAKRIKDIELVPVFMENLSRILPKGALVPVPLLSSISFGAPITLADGERKQDFLDRARKAMLSLQETQDD